MTLWINHFDSNTNFERETVICDVWFSTTKFMIWTLIGYTNSCPIYHLLIIYIWCHNCIQSSMLVLSTRSFVVLGYLSILFHSALTACSFVILSHSFVIISHSFFLLFSIQHPLFVVLSYSFVLFCVLHVQRLLFYTPWSFLHSYNIVDVIHIRRYNIQWLKKCPNVLHFFERKFNDKLHRAPIFIM